MQEGFQNFGGQNYDPNQLANQTSTAILFGVVIDVSPSIASYVHVMNEASREVFMKELKNSHRKNDIMVKCVKFNEDVSEVSGYMPILSLPDDYLDSTPSGGATALYSAVFKTLDSMIKYREDLENQGIEVRCNIFIITDGKDNASPLGTDKKVRDLVESLRQNEAWVNSFTFNMLGVGNRSYFEDACRNMGLDPQKVLVTVGSSGGDIRKQMGVVSQSVSSSAAQNAVSF